MYKKTDLTIGEKALQPKAPLANHAQLIYKQYIIYFQIIYKSEIGYIQFRNRSVYKQKIKQVEFHWLKLALKKVRN